MKREELLKCVRTNREEYDILVIGGGATGLGVAVDAASRGFRVMLCEQHDFAKATSSRSTKLVHGGVRYLQQGDVGMVVEALRERGRMRRNVPHLVRDMRFIIGNYRWWERPFYTLGLICYDVLAGRLGLGRSLPMTARAVKKELPGLKQDHLRGGVVYHDGQFDDARMAMTLVQTAQDYGAYCVNYLKVTEFRRNASGKLCGVKAVDTLSQEVFELKAKVIVNATGVFVDELMKLDNPDGKKKVRPSQGVHLVVGPEFLGRDSALMIPRTRDGRVLFGVPWHGKVVLGTTDTPLNEAKMEPRALEEEVNFILDQAGQYLERKPRREDVLSVFAGLRPLAAPDHDDAKKTKEISRSHKIYRSAGGLLTITGGKWTTYRQMAEEVVDRAIGLGGLPVRKCKTRNLHLHGYLEKVDRSRWDYVYGSDAFAIRQLVKEHPEWGEDLCPGYTFTRAHIVWAARCEYAQSVEDVLARRVRLLFLDARAAIAVAPLVAEILAGELGRDQAWQEEQVRDFTALARGYLLN